MKRQKRDLPSSPFDKWGNFERDFIIMLMDARILSISDIFNMRLVCRKWHAYVDGNTFYWTKLGGIILPMYDYSDMSTIIPMCAVFSLNGITDGDLEPVFALFKLSYHYRYLARNILNQFTKCPYGVLGHITPSKRINHPGAHGDTEDYSLIHCAPLNHSYGNTEFFFCRGQTILYRKREGGPLAWKPIRITELVAPYLESINNGI